MNGSATTHTGPPGSAIDVLRADAGTLAERAEAAARIVRRRQRASGEEAYPAG